MSSVFEVLFVFLFVVMSVLSSWEEMDIPVELLAYNVWASKDDKTGILNVGMDICDRLFLKEQLLKNENMINEDKWEKSTDQNMRFFKWMIKILFLVIHPYKKFEILKRG